MSILFSFHRSQLHLNLIHFPQYFDIFRYLKNIQFFISTEHVNKHQTLVLGRQSNRLD